MELSFPTKIPMCDEHTQAFAAVKSLFSPFPAHSGKCTATFLTPVRRSRPVV